MSLRSSCLAAMLRDYRQARVEAGGWLGTTAIVREKDEDDFLKQFVSAEKV